jgi:hypothetical protein
MVITKALALWLFVVGIVWAFVTALIDLVMTGFTDRIVSLPVFLISGFSGPLILATRDGHMAQPPRHVHGLGCLCMADLADRARLHFRNYPVAPAAGSA